MGEKSKAFDSRNTVDPLSEGRATQEVRFLEPGGRTPFSNRETTTRGHDATSQTNENNDFAFGEIIHKIISIHINSQEFMLNSQICMYNSF